MYTYSVQYRRDISRRKYRLTVIARNPDEARQFAKLCDPLFLAPVGYPRRGRVVVDATGEQNK
jgi:hypothetical protein